MSACTCTQHKMHVEMVMECCAGGSMIQREATPCISKRIAFTTNITLVFTCNALHATGANHYNGPQIVASFFMDWCWWVANTVLKEQLFIVVMACPFTCRHVDRCVGFSEKLALTNACTLPALIRGFFVTNHRRLHEQFVRGSTIVGETLGRRVIH